MPVRSQNGAADTEKYPTLTGEKIYEEKNPEKKAEQDKRRFIKQMKDFEKFGLKLYFG